MMLILVSRQFFIIHQFKLSFYYQVQNLSMNNTKNLNNQSNVDLDVAIIQDDIQSTPPSRKIKEFMRKKQNANQQQFNMSNIMKQLLDQSHTQCLVTPTMSKHQYTQFIKTRTAKIKKKNQLLYEDLCPICLCAYSQPKAKLQCNHQFCYTCIQQWVKTATVCPCCRYKFQTIMKNGCQIIQVQSKQMKFNQQDYLVCYVCGRGDNQHVLLVCDECDYYCCHIYCDQELSLNVPEGDWFCRHCQEIINTRHNQQNQQQQKQRATTFEMNLTQNLTSRSNLYDLRRLRRRN